MKRITAYLIIALMLFYSTACSDNNKNETPRTQVEYIWMGDIFIDVLKSNTPFIEGFQGERILLSEYLNNLDNDFNFEITEFAIIKREDGKTREVIVTSTNNIFRIVFHYWNGDIYGFMFGFREMQTIDIKGTFISSGSAFNTNLNRLNFIDGVYERTILAYSDLNRDDADNNFMEYFIGDKLVSEEEFLSFLEENYARDVEWYLFSEETLKDDFIEAWHSRVLEEF